MRNKSIKEIIKGLEAENNNVASILSSINKVANVIASSIEKREELGIGMTSEDLNIIKKYAETISDYSAQGHKKIKGF